MTGKQQMVALEKTTPELLREFSLKPRIYTESSLIEVLRGLRTYIPLPSEEKEINAHTKSLVRKWFSYRMRKKYDELSPEIFELQREIEIDKKYFKDVDSDGEKIKLKIPMLIQAKLLDKGDGWKEKFTYRSRYDNYTLDLSSRIPRVPLDVRKAGKEAIGFTYIIYGEALATEVLSDVINENSDYAPYPKHAELLVLWKPKPSEIHIKARHLDNDPALVLKWDRPYLVTTWKEPNEEPFMDVISACRIIDFLEK